MKIYVYKMVADNGGAPCVWRGLMSLALCKPVIRRRAGKGDMIFGFGGKEYGERLIYVAWVTEDKLTAGAYYGDRTYSERPDCIYRDVGGTPERKPDAKYHYLSDESHRDVGSNFERAHVLLSRDFRYFGNKATDDYKRSFPAVKALIEGLGRGHRVNHSPEVHEQLLNLANQLRLNYPQMRIGEPNDGDCAKTCNR
jgi:hypothetical protein